MTINAPVDAKSGTLTLAAAGNTATDDIIINSTLSGASAAIYAGDSITLDEKAELSSSATELFVATNYDPATQSTSTGNSGGKLAVTNPNISFVLNDREVGTMTDGRVYDFSPIGIIFMDDYFNALEPVLEFSAQSSELGISGIGLSHTDGVELENSGEVVVEEEE